MYTAENYVKALSLQEAWELNQNRKNAVLGGGMWLRTGSGNFETIIDLEKLGLDSIEEREKDFRIGCMTPLRALETHEGLRRNFGSCFADCVRPIVGTQFRNTATIGGGVAGRFGFSDVMTCLLALEASVELYRAGIIPIREYAQGKGLGRDILVAVLAPKQDIRVSYRTVRKTKTDFPITACAMTVKDDVYIAVIGARPGRAVIIENTEDLDAAAFAFRAAEQISFGDDLRCGREYRKFLAGETLGKCADDLLKGGF